ncbi:MAG TPA: DUF4124 domain-containing protein [Burkholderiales bacterium]|jgi:hypothetical protein|nr:DUF4124 domain-containing protein [Burkholderiales bacterium]
MKTPPRSFVLSRLLAVFLGAAFALAGIAAHAEVFKWVDENGKTQFSDKPPPNQKNVKQLNINSNVSPADKAAAERRAAAEKASAQVGTPKAAPKAEAKAKPADTADEGKSDYQKSLDCFAKYRQPNGRMSPEAGANCQEVKTPN